MWTLWPRECFAQYRTAPALPQPARVTAMAGEPARALVTDQITSSSAIPDEDDSRRAMAVTAAVAAAIPAAIEGVLNGAVRRNELSLVVKHRLQTDRGSASLFCRRGRTRWRGRTGGRGHARGGRRGGRGSASLFCRHGFFPGFTRRFFLLSRHRSPEPDPLGSLT